MRRWEKALLGSPILLATLAGAASPEPYIETVRKHLEAPKTEEAGSYTQKLKKQLKQSGQTDGYTEAIRARWKKEGSEPEKPSEESFTDQQRRILLQKEQDAESRPGAIESVLHGKSELRPEKKGAIHHAIAFKVGTFGSRQVSPAGADSTAQTFSALYGSGFNPDLKIQYEYQPFHSEIFGNFGFLFSTGIGAFRGRGVFRFNLQNPATGASFGSESETFFRFLEVPVLFGANYRFNLLRWIRPYAQAAAGVNLYAETREDNNATQRGYSRVAALSAGVNFLLDPLMPETTWGLYASNGVHHLSLLVDYTRMMTLAGELQFAVDGVSVGLTYEF